MLPKTPKGVETMLRFCLFLKHNFSRGSSYQGYMTQHQFNTKEPSLKILNIFLGELQPGTVDTGAK